MLSQRAQNQQFVIDVSADHSDGNDASFLPFTSLAVEIDKLLFQPAEIVELRTPAGRNGFGIGYPERIDLQLVGPVFSRWPFVGIALFTGDFAVEPAQIGELVQDSLPG